MSQEEQPEFEHDFGPEVVDRSGRGLVTDAKQLEARKIIWKLFEENPGKVYFSRQMNYCMKTTSTTGFQIAPCVTCIPAVL